MKVLDTNRLTLRWLTLKDALFILELLNEPSWLKYIGDKGVKTLADAQNYIQQGPVAMYGKLGFGLYLVELRCNQDAIGICGFLKRDSLDDVDIGFAFLPKFWGKGYAFESASAVIGYGRTVLGFSQILAITSPENHPSGRLLEKLGFRFQRLINSHNSGETLKLYVAIS